MRITDFLKVEDCKAGDQLIIKDAGEWISHATKVRDDGSPQQSCQFSVLWHGEIKDITLSKLNRMALKAAWGPDTDDWVGKVAVIKKIADIQVAGKARKQIILGEYAGEALPEEQTVPAVDAAGEKETATWE